MDPSIFLPYSPPNGLPQESKLATYMNRSVTTPVRSLTHTLGKVSLETSPNIKKVILGPECFPLSYYAPQNLIPVTPESSPPAPALLVQSSPQQQVHQENVVVGGTTYFYPHNADGLSNSGTHNSSHNASMGHGGHAGPPEAILGGNMAVAAPTPSPYATQMYIGPAHHMPMPSKPGLAATFYLPETIRAEIYERNEEILAQVDRRQYPDLPENVEMYSELTPLERYPGHGVTHAWSLRARHRATGEMVALRRLPLHHASPLAAKRLDLWKQVIHPNVARLRDVFTSNAFGDHSTILVYEYHPGGVTLLAKYLVTGPGASSESGAFHDPFSSDPDAPRPYTHQKNAMLRAVASGQLLPEAVLWSLLVQLTAALRAVHSLGLACRNLDPSKVIMNGCRVRIAWGGAAEASGSGGGASDAQAQQDDLASLGRLALALATRTLHCDNLPASMDLVARTYSADLKNLILYLLSTSTARRSVTDLMPMIGARFYTQVEALERRADAFEEQLAREVDNGRLLRILIKLGVVNERPELNMDPSWSETGDRYMLKLFRDYLFHAVGADGRPWLDQSHLTHCLNHLDAGSPEKVELMSRDEQSVLVVSYAELKHCLDQAFEEVTQAAAQPQ